MTSPVPPREDPDKLWRSEGAPPPPPAPHKPSRRNWFSMLLTALIVFLLIDALLNLFGNGGSISVPYTEFTKQLNAGQVSEIYAKGDSIQGKLKSAQPQPGDGRKTYQQFSTQRPTFASDQLWSELTAQNVKVDAEPVVKERSFLANLLLSLAPMLLLVLLWVFIARRMSAGGAMGGLARKAPPKPIETPPDGRRTTFDDVAGIDEVKGELTEVVDFLRRPDAYRKLGAKMPRGVLLAGPPGTGKTLCWRARSPRSTCAAGSSARSAGWRPSRSSTA
ncbi:ATP-dependent Zn protease [Streptacidiphilus sp. MAP5-52]